MKRLQCLAPSRVLVLSFFLSVTWRTVTILSTTVSSKSSRYLQSHIELKSPEFQPQCPPAISANVGIFQNSNSRNNTSHNDGNPFKDVVLVVASNYAYYDMLQNWEYLASRLGIQWAVLALDAELYKALGPERAFLDQDDDDHDWSVSGGQNFRTAGFNRLACNKMRLVMQVMRRCDVDVVFCDVDNVFFQNPFHHDLGKLIASRQFDYLYQVNKPIPNQAKSQQSDSCLLSRGPRGLPEKRMQGNTGFYYVSRKSERMKTIVNRVLETCQQPDNKLDDQILFWNIFWDSYSSMDEEEKNLHYHCTRAEYENFTDATTTTIQKAIKNNSNSFFRFCCLDPFHYPVGRQIRSILKFNPNPVTFHANFVHGKENKINLLKRSPSPKGEMGWNPEHIRIP